MDRPLLGPTSGTSEPGRVLRPASKLSRPSVSAWRIVFAVLWLLAIAAASIGALVDRPEFADVRASAWPALVVGGLPAVVVAIVVIRTRPILAVTAVGSGRVVGREQLDHDARHTLDGCAWHRGHADSRPCDRRRRLRRGRGLARSEADLRRAIAARSACADRALRSVAVRRLGRQARGHRRVLELDFWREVARADDAPEKGGVTSPLQLPLPVVQTSPTRSSRAGATTTNDTSTRISCPRDPARSERRRARFRKPHGLGDQTAGRVQGRGVCSAARRGPPRRRPARRERARRTPRHAARRRRGARPLGARAGDRGDRQGRSRPRSRPSSSCPTPTATRSSCRACGARRCVLVVVGVVVRLPLRPARVAEPARPLAAAGRRGRHRRARRRGERGQPFIEKAKPEHPSLIDEAHVSDELFGFVNVPNGVWIDEEGMIVRPAEPAHPGGAIPPTSRSARSTCRRCRPTSPRCSSRRARSRATPRSTSR